MKLPKSEIKLSEFHPSLLLNLAQQSVFYAPVVLDQEGTLVDGYRRYQLCADQEIEAVAIQTESIFDAAVALNERTRHWDETDCFLWLRWARHLGVSTSQLPTYRFSEQLFDADDSILSILANRKLLLRQVLMILDAPRRYRPCFIKFITETIHLNVNETQSFIETCCDLANMLNIRDLEELFGRSELLPILQDSSLSQKQKGERLLKQMRILRYPYYQTKLNQLSSNWRQLNLDQNFHVKKNSFLERGLLEISFSSGSLEEMKEKATALYKSLNSPIWDRIWE